MTLKRDGYVPRLIDNVLKRCLSIFGTVNIIGLKWCEKTWAHEIDEGAGSVLKMDRKIRGQADGRPSEFMCVVCAMANAAYRRDDGVYVAPSTALGP